MVDWYKTARLAEKNGTLQTCAVEFLRDSGNNSKLASTIEKRGHLHIGLIDYPVHKLKSEVGVGEGYKWPEDETTFYRRIDSMVDSLSKGWKPAPLIATNFWEDYFEVSDGAHRHAALSKAGIHTYPTLFFCRDKESLDSLKKTL